YLIERGVEPKDFNSYGSRRGNHEVMVRGTFANVRLRNRLVPGVEGGYTLHLPSGEQMTIFEAAERYQAGGVPLVVSAGKEYGSGTSRDRAAKGPRLLGVRAVLAESFERIHRSNLVGMGVLPLQFRPGESAEALGLTGREVYDIEGVAEALAAEGEARSVRVRATKEDGSRIEFRATVRVDTPQEAEYYRHGGILQYVLRQLRAGRERPAAVSAHVAATPVAETLNEPPPEIVDVGSSESFPASDPPAYCRARDAAPPRAQRGRASFEARYSSVPAPGSGGQRDGPAAQCRNTRRPVNTIA